MGIRIPRYSVFRELEAQQREFADTIEGLFFDGSGSVLKIISLDILKLVEMWGLDGGRYINHWLDISTEELYKLKRKNIPPQVAFSWIENDSVLRKVIGENHLSRFRRAYPTPKSYLDFLKDSLLVDTSDSSGSSPKYRSWFQNNNFYFENKDSDYLSLFKYIALCMSGQLSPNQNVGDFYSMIISPEFRNMSVNYKTVRPYSKENLIDIVRDCVKDVLYVFEF